MRIGIPPHSYWRACRTFRREARRAGSTRPGGRRRSRRSRTRRARRTARRRPTPSSESATRDERRQEHADGDSERGADQRRHDALVPDHPAHLAARHADRPQHPELTSALEDGQDERVHHPEQADDHREPEQRVDDVEERARDPCHPGVLELSRVCTSRVREAGERALQRVRVGSGGAAVDVHEREVVPRLRNDGVEGAVEMATGPNGRAALRLVRRCL